MAINFKKNQGMSALEIIVALGVASVSLTAATMVTFSNQSMGISTVTNQEALEKIRSIIEKTRGEGEEVFHAVHDENEMIDTYRHIRTVTDLTQCKKKIKEKIVWMADSADAKKLELDMVLTSRKEMLSFGGDCDVEETTKTWQTPTSLGSHALGGAQMNGIDVLNGIAYMAGPGPKGLYIVDVTTPAIPTEITFNNGFQDAVTLNGIDVARAADGQIYAYVARNASTDQFRIIKVTDPRNPVTMGSVSLTDVSPIGTAPEGRSVYYHKNYAYVGTRYSAGPEFHIIDVSNPASPVEVGQKAINHNVNAIIAREEVIDGVKKKVAYLATSGNAAISEYLELVVLDITTPSPASAIKAITAYDLPSTADAKTLWITGNTLLVGRETSTTTDFHIIDTKNLNPLLPNGGLTTLKDLEVGTSANRVRANGKFVFIATSNQFDPLLVYDISNPANPVQVNTSALSNNQKSTGLDYENGYIFTANNIGDALRVITSP